MKTQPMSREGFLQRWGLATLLIASLSNLGCQADPVPDSHGVTHRTTPEGVVVTMHLASAPFPHPNRKAGYASDTENFPFQGHYSDSSVQVFIPKGWVEGTKIDLVFFFHGWLTSVDGAIEVFDLLNQFKRSKVNALLVLPETARFAPDSFGGKLEDDGGFQALVQETLDTLHKRKYIRGANPGRIFLVAHSGGYHVISQILSHGGLADHVSDVILFDALYGNLEDFEQWIARRRGLFVSVFTQDGEVGPLVKNMIEDLKKIGIPYLFQEESMGNPMPPKAVRAVFYHSVKDHYDVVHDDNQFQHLLRMVAARKN